MVARKLQSAARRNYTHEGMQSPLPFPSSQFLTPNAAIPSHQFSPYAFLHSSHTLEKKLRKNVSGYRICYSGRTESAIGIIGSCRDSELHFVKKTKQKLFTTVFS